LHKLIYPIKTRLTRLTSTRLIRAFGRSVAGPLIWGFHLTKTDVQVRNRPRITWRTTLLLLGIFILLIGQKVLNLKPDTCASKNVFLVHINVTQINEIVNNFDHCWNFWHCNSAFVIVEYLKDTYYQTSCLNKEEHYCVCRSFTLAFSLFILIYICRMQLSLSSMPC
jgi:hypothetical protein